MERHAELEHSAVALGQAVALLFLKRFITDGTRTRIHEPVNGYNAEDPGMQIVAPLINAAIGG